MFAAHHGKSFVPSIFFLWKKSGKSTNPVLCLLSLMTIGIQLSLQYDCNYFKQDQLGLS